MPRPERPADAPKAVEPDEAANAEPYLENIPVPEPRPVQAGDEKSADARPDDKQRTVPKPERPTKDDLTPSIRPVSMPADELACRARLRELGVAFRELPQLSDKAGCSAPWPIQVADLGSDVELAPAGAVNCAIAERSARFIREVVVPASQKLLGSPVKVLRHASAYVCRPRNGTNKLSEHAFGNALDVDGFVLADKRTLGVGRVQGQQEAKFMLAVRLAACGPYTTVLGPGSNADHATHLHLDLAKRRPGSTYCR